MADTYSNLDSFGTHHMKLGLERITDLLQGLGNPERDFETILVGGTNGKGSTCAFMASIMKEAALKVGLYTSPHVQVFQERVTVDGICIPGDFVTRFMERIQPIMAAMERDPDMGAPTYFEVTTALAFDYFSHEKVDIAVVEVGLGGRLDATNVLEPALSIITNVSRDHAQVLGDSLEEIASEKAGIIKEGIPVITAASGIPLEVLERVSIDRQAKLISMGKGYTKRTPNGFEGQTFKTLWRGKEATFKTSLIGGHQATNASLAVKAAEVLKLDLDHVLKGIESTVPLPGRAEVVSRKPLVILDGAHNPGAAMALKKTLDEIRVEGERVLIIGMLKDKDIRDVVMELEGSFERIIITRPATDRAADPEDIRVFVRGRIIHDVKEAVRKTMEDAAPKDLICVTGSFFTVGEARDLFFPARTG